MQRAGHGRGAVVEHELEHVGVPGLALRDLLLDEVEAEEPLADGPHLGVK